jgi:hypothetical protein
MIGETREHADEKLMPGSRLADGDAHGTPKISPWSGISN